MLKSLTFFISTILFIITFLCEVKDVIILTNTNYLLFCLFISFVSLSKLSLKINEISP